MYGVDVEYCENVFLLLVHVQVQKCHAIVNQYKHFFFLLLIMDSVVQIYTMVFMNDIKPCWN